MKYSYSVKNKIWFILLFLMCPQTYLMHILKYRMRNGEWKQQNSKKKKKTLNFAIKFSRLLEVDIAFVEKQLMRNLGDGNSCFKYFLM